MQPLTLQALGSSLTIDILEEQFSENGLAEYAVGEPGQCLAEGEEIVYAFVPTVNATVTFETTSATDTVLALFESTCTESGAATAICNDDVETGNRNSSLVASVQAGTIYFLVYDHFSDPRDVGILTITSSP